MTRKKKKITERKPLSTSERRRIYLYLKLFIMQVLSKINQIYCECFFQINNIQLSGENYTKPNF